MRAATCAFQRASEVQGEAQKAHNCAGEELNSESGPDRAGRYGGLAPDRIPDGRKRQSLCVGHRRAALRPWETPAPPKAPKSFLIRPGPTPSALLGVRNYYTCTFSGRDPKGRQVEHKSMCTLHSFLPLSMPSSPWVDASASKRFRRHNVDFFLTYPSTRRMLQNHQTSQLRKRDAL